MISLSITWEPILGIGFLPCHWQSGSCWCRQWPRRLFLSYSKDPSRSWQLRRTHKFLPFSSARPASGHLGPRALPPWRTNRCPWAQACDGSTCRCRPRCIFCCRLPSLGCRPTPLGAQHCLELARFNRSLLAIGIRLACFGRCLGSIRASRKDITYYNDTNTIHTNKALFL